MNKKLIWGIVIAVVLVIIAVVLVMKNSEKQKDKKAAEEAAKKGTSTPTPTTGSKPKGTVLPFDQVPRMVTAPTSGSKFVLDGTTYEFNGAQWLAI